MLLNDDFSQPIDIAYADAVWAASPQAGVDRHMLDRIGAEKARATSIVRYAAESRFSTHTHDEGEEFVVLDGTFSDATGDFGTGTYVRNPPGSAHAPWSVEGTTIFVKLRQFDPNDLERVVIDPAKAAWEAAGAAGVRRLALHQFGTESVSMLRLKPGAAQPAHSYPAGIEVLVLDGEIVIDGVSRHPWDWLRRPDGAELALSSVTGGTVFLKTGHLPS